MFTLSNCYRDFQCPHCSANVEVEWDTEYGDPLGGDHDGACPTCGKTFTFCAYTTYSVRKE